MSPIRGHDTRGAQKRPSCQPRTVNAAMRPPDRDWPYLCVTRMPEVGPAIGIILLSILVMQLGSAKYRGVYTPGPYSDSSSESTKRGADFSALFGLMWPAASLE